MSLLLCAATSFEIQPTVNWIASEKLPVKVLITGVGLISTTYALTREVILNRPDMIVQAGVGGCFHEQVNLGTVVAIRSERIADQGVEEKGEFRDLLSMGLLQSEPGVWTGNQLINDLPWLNITQLPVMNSISVNEITTRTERINWYRDQYHAHVESMEGAALHLVGLKEKIPFLQVRSLSNYAGERNKEKWQMKKAVEELNQTLPDILKNWI